MSAIQANTTSPTDATFRTLVRTLGILRRVMQPFFASFGLSGAQWGVLRVVQRAEEEGRDGLRLTELGDRLLVRPPSVTGVVERLRRLGLISTRKLASDQRVRIIRLTPTGRQRVGRVLSAMGTQVEGVLGGLDDHERTDLQRLLEKLCLHLERDENGSTGSDITAEEEPDTETT
jgi:MarR family 2-MHQ and catechol resistance regulon transcriptional repressor